MQVSPEREREKGKETEETSRERQKGKERDRMRWVKRSGSKQSRPHLHTAGACDQQPCNYMAI